MKSKVPSPNPDYLQFLSPFEPRVIDLALAARKLVLGEAPDAAELIYDAYNAVATGYSFTGRPSDAFIHIAVYTGWVNLGFNRGSLLADPSGVLKGAGRWIRQARIAKTADFEQPALRELVKAAVASAERPDVRTAGIGGKSVVRAVYAKKRRPR